MKALYHLRSDFLVCDFNNDVWGFEGFLHSIVHALMFLGAGLRYFKLVKNYRSSRSLGCQRHNAARVSVFDQAFVFTMEPRTENGVTWKQANGIYLSAASLSVPHSAVWRKVGGAGLTAGMENKVGPILIYWFQGGLGEAL